MNLPSRSVLDRELNDLENQLAELGSLVEAAIEEAMAALAERNVSRAQQVIRNDEQINVQRYKLEEDCLRILATQQPKATDLRTVLATLHIAIELERMGDHAAGIAALVERMEEDPDIDSLHKLPKMTRRATKMVHEALSGYLNRDMAVMEKLVKRDEKLDRQYVQFFQQMVVEMRAEDDFIRQGTFLLWVAHNLERIGDRATNIAERVIFMHTGAYPESVI